jgi:cation transporter-like permease
LIGPTASRSSIRLEPLLLPRVMLEGRFLMKATNFDPDFASAPFVVTLIDIAGIVIYFGIALLFLTGTLL